MTVIGRVNPTVSFLWCLVLAIMATSPSLGGTAASAAATLPVSNTSIEQAAPTGANAESRTGNLSNSGVRAVTGIAAMSRPAAPPPPPPAKGTALGLSDATKIGRLATFCVAGNGNIFACDSKDSSIKILTPSDSLVAAWKLPFAPSAIASAGDAVFVGGIGRLDKLDKDGKVVKEFDLASLELPKARVAHLAASGADVFASVMARTGYEVWRFDFSLENPARIISGLRGCCGQMGLYAAGGRLYVAENARYRVACYDRQGQVLASWIKANRGEGDAFGGCCNPMNLFAAADGTVYTAESNTGQIKAFSAEGRYLGTIGAAPIGSGCIHVAIWLSPDGKTVYVADITRGYIHILANTPPSPAATQPATQSAARG